GLAPRLTRGLAPCGSIAPTDSFAGGTNAVGSHRLRHIARLPATSLWRVAGFFVTPTVTRSDGNPGDRTVVFVLRTRTPSETVADKGIALPKSWRIGASILIIGHL